MKRLKRFAFALALTGLVALAAGPKASVGKAAPNFTLEDQHGNEVSLSDFKDKVVVLEWVNPDCPFVKRHYKAGTMTGLYQQFKGKDVVWLAINSTHYAKASDNKSFAKDKDVTYPILQDQNGKVGRIYGAQTTPHMFVINKGTLVYDGAIDDSPRGGDISENYVKKALSEVLAGKNVTTPKTKPYGCSVKYARH